MPTGESAYLAAPAPVGWLSRAGAALRHLYVQVLIGVVLGILLGAFDPAAGVALKPLGDVLIKAIRLVVTPVIFTTIVVGIATMSDMRRFARVGLRAIIYFEVISTIALIVGMAVGNLWPIGAGINADPHTLDSTIVAPFVQDARSMTLVNFLIGIVPSTFIEPFVRGDLLPVLFVAVLFGLALCRVGETVKPLLALLDQLSAGLFAMVRLIMYAAPIGAFGAMAFTVGKYGVGTLLSLGQLVLGVYLVSIIFVVLVLGLALRWAGFGLWKVLAYFKEELLFVFAATSAETMIPQSMRKLERLGCSKDVVGLVMPAGFSFNMDGTAIYMTMSVLFIAHATNTPLSLGQQFAMLLVMLFTSKGAAGVTGGGFVALAATLPALGVLPVAGLALLIGVDRFMAEIRAATNLASNLIATLVVGRWVGGIDLRRAHAVLDGVAPPELEGDTAFPGQSRPA